MSDEIDRTKVWPYDADPFESLDHDNDCDTYSESICANVRQTTHKVSIMDYLSTLISPVESNPASITPVIRHIWRTLISNRSLKRR